MLTRWNTIAVVTLLCGGVDGRGGYQWGGAAGTMFWVDTRNNIYGVFMIQRWGYRPPTYRVFQKHVRRAILPAKKPGF